MFRLFGHLLLLTWLAVAPCSVAHELADGAAKSRSKSSLTKVEAATPVAVTRVRMVGERFIHSVRVNKAPWVFALVTADTLTGEKTLHDSPIARVIQFDAHHLVTCGVKLQV